MGSTYKKLLVAVDTGLLLYWTAVFLNLIPEHLRFKDYSNQIIQAWNWSFFPLDLAAALTVFLGAYLTRVGSRDRGPGADGRAHADLLRRVHGDLLLVLLP